MTSTRHALSDPAVESALRQAAALFRRSQYAVALVGAGLSAESGIPTYRGSGGIYERFGEPTIDGWELFVADPAEWWRQAIAHETSGSPFSQAIDRAAPNPGHYAMADLEHMGRLAHVITQNIDNLHAMAGSRRVTEIHGNRYKVRCIECGARERLETVNLDRLPPSCPVCGGLYKNDVVMFGEPIPRDALEECYRQTLAADLFLTIGTSAVVYPAADFPVLAKRRGAPLIEINPETTALSEIADVIIRAPAGVALPALVDLLLVP
ncbi:MAG: NAD-dependent deacylase [Tepidiforma sp.]|uniref:SIR2 family NAD-dependent protein deacylase n=1 Tax=Tepidiforma sp. TaxID=2682230 RepID=UPI0021DE978E|nr:NAD-dependent deacylase [Tepidiforma sp.]GIW15301.1 MAG: NAD-dependent deacylase [Tepidiforma sp.]